MAPAMRSPYGIDPTVLDSIWSSLYIAGSGWGEPVRVETDNTNSARNARVAFDTNGNAIAVWIQSDGLRDNVLANRYTAGQGWGSAVLIETDNAGRAHGATDRLRRQRQRDRRLVASECRRLHLQHLGQSLDRGHGLGHGGA